ncbi:MAG TPA: transglycosylase SLT domain-containing protein [Burkholderiales bacterium]|nr:transglycosylase SLT domain-containing protein [Burkholderiales bacterium]
MIFKVFRNLAAAVAFVLAAGGAGAKDSTDESLLAAYDAYRAGDPIKLARHARKLDGHVLEPWLDYWRLSMRLEDIPNREVREFLATHANLYVSERLRADWLRVLGKRSEWPEFDRQSVRYTRDDLEVSCYRWISRLEHGDDSALDEATAMWVEPTELPDGCQRLSAILSTRGRLSVTDVWRRVRVLFEHGQITAAKTALALLPKSEAPDERLLAEAARQPKRFIERLPKVLETRAAREVAILGAIRYARNDAAGAAAALAGPLAERLSEAELRYVWGIVGYEGAREHHEDALKWFARAGDTPLDDRHLAWKVRAALRDGEWKVVRESIDRMSFAIAHHPTWVYWYGRALAAQGEEMGSRAYFLRIAGQADFYGLLASEELGYLMALPDVTHVPSEQEVAAAAAEPGLKRALELIRLGIRVEGVREWLHTIRSFDDARLLAAAELARRNGVYDRAIHTADRTSRLHNFTLRYPMPYQDVFRGYAATHGVDEAWVLGLVRQESRFNTDARSSAGAAGLMQVMPRTARYVAAKIGLRNYRPKTVTEIETNVTLGTGYLRLVMEQLGHPVLASAAYNAGPSRARRWRDDKPLEGAVYVESIPFAETRDYVKKVMANAVYYAAVLERKPVPLKSRLGVIQPPGALEPPVFEDEPR